MATLHEIGDVFDTDVDEQTMTIVSDPMTSKTVEQELLHKIYIIIMNNRRACQLFPGKTTYSKGQIHVTIDNPDGNVYFDIDHDADWTHFLIDSIYYITPTGRNCRAAMCSSSEWLSLPDITDYIQSRRV